ncbi:MAG: DUF177 domain-containing protein [Erysipelotrichia bacterium]|nr:DUF177 domain-containing protein [Erysipelotrichia bacterium]
MKINRSTLPIQKDLKIKGTIDFSTYPLDGHHIRQITRCEVVGVLHEFEDVLRCKVNGFAEVIAPCSYTLDDVALKVKFKEEFFFSADENCSKHMDYEAGDIIDLGPYVLALICAAVPHNLVKPGAKLPSSGKGYRVLTEDDFLLERSKKSNPAFAILDELLPADEDDNHL